MKWEIWDIGGAWSVGNSDISGDGGKSLCKVPGLKPKLIALKSGESISSEYYPLIFNNDDP